VDVKAKTVLAICECGFTVTVRAKCGALETKGLGTRLVIRCVNSITSAVFLNYQHHPYRYAEDKLG